MKTLKNCLFTATVVLLFLNSSIAQVEPTYYTATDLASYPATNVSAKEKSSNAHYAIHDIQQYIQANLDFPEYLREYYSGKLEVIASFYINNIGEIEKITIQDIGIKKLEKDLARKLKKLKTVTTVIENGQVVSKKIHVPIRFTL